jgi:hypothetical protein
MSLAHGTSSELHQHRCRRRIQRHNYESMPHLQKHIALANKVPFPIRIKVVTHFISIAADLSLPYNLQIVVFVVANAVSKLGYEPVPAT